MLRIIAPDAWLYLSAAGVSNILNPDMRNPAAGHRDYNRVAFYLNIKASPLEGLYTNVFVNHISAPYFVSCI